MAANSSVNSLGLAMARARSRAATLRQAAIAQVLRSCMEDRPEVTAAAIGISSETLQAILTQRHSVREATLDRVLAWAHKNEPTHPPFAA